MAEALVAVGIDPARERIDAAREGAIGMNATAALVEEHAGPVLPGLEDGAARLRVAGEELGGRQTQPASEAQRLVGPHANRLAVAAALARVADVREAAASLEAEIDLRQEVTVWNGRAPDEGSRYCFPSALPSALPPDLPSPLPPPLPSPLPALLPLALPLLFPSALPSAFPSPLPSVLPSVLPWAIESAGRTPMATPNAAMAAASLRVSRRLTSACSGDCSFRSVIVPLLAVVALQSPAGGTIACLAGLPKSTIRPSLQSQPAGGGPAPRHREQPQCRWPRNCFSSSSSLRIRASRSPVSWEICRSRRSDRCSCCAIFDCSSASCL